MVDTKDCERCGTALSYGEIFRHQLAVEVSSGKIDAKRILGDRLSPRSPLQLCSLCRCDVTKLPMPASAASSNHHWLLSLMAAVAGAFVLTAMLHVRRS
jgi:hypothetical protein